MPSLSLFLFLLALKISKTDIFFDSDFFENGDGSKNYPFNDFMHAMVFVFEKENISTERLFLQGKKSGKFTSEQGPLTLDEDRTMIISSNTGFSLDIEHFPSLLIKNSSSLTLINISFFGSLSSESARRNNFFFWTLGGEINFYGISMMHLNFEGGTLFYCENGTFFMDSVTFERTKIISQIFCFNQCEVSIKSLDFVANSLVNQNVLFLMKNGNVKIELLNFTNNTLQDQSIMKNGFQGALINLSDLNLLSIDSTFFVTNFGENLDLIRIEKVSVTEFTNIIFHRNVLRNASFVILIQIEFASFSNIDFHSNMAKINVLFSKLSVLEINNFQCLYNNYDLEGENQHLYGGPCILFDPTDLLATRTLIMNSQFSYSQNVNTAALLIFEAFVYSIIFINTTFSHNRVLYETILNDSNYRQGGLLTIYSPSKISILSCVFKNNTFIKPDSDLRSKFGTAGVYVENKFAEISINGSIFLNNEGLLGSSCIFANSEYLSIDLSTFGENTNILDNKEESRGGSISTYASFIFLFRVLAYGNKAKFGGFVFFRSRTSTSLHKLYIKNSTFESNQGKNYGVIVLILNSYRIYISDCIFERNNAEIAPVMGGDVFSDEFYSMVVNCEFAWNTALKKGGVFYISHIGGMYIFENCSFLYNKAYKAGVFHYAGSQAYPLILKGCQFFHNQAVIRAGVASISFGHLIDSDSVYYNNTAGSEGGVFILENQAIVDISNCSFDLSLAGKVGGVAVLMEENILKISNYSVIKNSYAPLGSCIVVYSYSSVEIEDSLYFFNKAAKGTLLYLSNCIKTSIIERVIFNNNYASVDGLFKFDFSSALIKNTSLLKNHGNLFSLTRSFVNIEIILALELNCSNDIQQPGCLLSAKLDSSIFITSFKFLNCSIGNKKYGLQTKKTFLAIEEGIMFDLGKDTFPSIFKIEFSKFSMRNFTHYESISLAISARTSHLNLSNAIYTGSINLNGTGFLLCDECLELSIESSSFSTSSSSIGGAIFIKGKLMGNLNISSFSIRDCIFWKNMASRGGAIYVYNQNISIILNKFLENDASERAGAIYFTHSEYEFKLDIIMKNNYFYQNVAKYSGGAVYWIFSEPANINSNNYSDNKAPHGNNFATEPTYILPSSKINYDIFKSGSSFVAILNFTIVDAYLQAVSVPNKGSGWVFWRESEILGNSSVKGIFGNTRSEINNESLSFDDLRFIYTPNSSGNLCIRTDLNFQKWLPYHEEYLQSAYTFAKNSRTNILHENEGGVYTLTLLIMINSCESGEIYSLNTNTCEQCPYGKYSIDPRDSICYDCPMEMICYGGSNVTVKPGYWRSSNRSFDFYKCDSRQGACVGGFLEDLCRIGHTGPLCKSCVYNSVSKYIKGQDLQCVDCGEFNSTVGFYIVFLLMVLVIVLEIVLIKFTLAAYYSAKKKLLLGGNIHSEIRRAEKKSKITTYFRVMINHIQLLSLLFLIKIDWGVIIKDWEELTKSSSNFGSLLHPFECWIGELAFLIGYNIYIVKIILTLASFYFILLALAIILIIRKILARTSILGAELKASFLITFFLVQPSLINIFLSALKCKEINGERFISEETAIKCGDKEFLRMIVIPILPNLLLIMIIAPLLLFIYLKRNIKEICSTEKYFLFEFILAGYKKELYYWEFFNMIRKYTIITALSFGDSNFVSIISLFTFTTLFSLIELKKKPFNLTSLNLINVFGNIALFTSFSVAIILGTSVSEETEILLVIILISANGIFLLTWLRGVLPIHLFLLFAKFIQSRIFRKTQKIGDIKNQLQKQNKIKFNFNKNLIINFR